MTACWNCESTYGYSFEEGPDLEIGGTSCRAYYFASRVEAEQIAEEFDVEASPAPKG
jgi:hypothetical protein